MRARRASAVSVSFSRLEPLQDEHVLAVGAPEERRSRNAVRDDGVRRRLEMLGDELADGDLPREPRGDSGRECAPKRARATRGAKSVAC